MLMQRIEENAITTLKLRGLPYSVGTGPECDLGDQGGHRRVLRAAGGAAERRRRAVDRDRTGQSATTQRRGVRDLRVGGGLQGWTEIPHAASGEEVH